VEEEEEGSDESIHSGGIDFSTATTQRFNLFLLSHLLRFFVYESKYWMVFYIIIVIIAITITPTHRNMIVPPRKVSITRRCCFLSKDYFGLSAYPLPHNRRISLIVGSDRSHPSLSMNQYLSTFSIRISLFLNLFLCSLDFV
jgi:hypothetical protein